MAKKAEWAIAQNVGASFWSISFFSTESEMELECSSTRVSSHSIFALFLPSASFRHPPSFWLVWSIHTHTHSLAPSCFPPDRYLGPSFSFIGPSPSSSSETSRLTWNLKEKTLLLKKKKNVEKVERGSEAEEEKIKRRDFCFSLFLGRRPKRADDDDGINNRDIVDFHVEQHRLGSKKKGSPCRLVVVFLFFIDLIWNEKNEKSIHLIWLVYFSFAGW